jgi:predicted glycogen debranching enzyme
MGLTTMNLTDLTSLRLSDLTERDWKISNRLGAYASSSLACMNTRRSHGLLVAPISRGAQRLVLLSRVEESLRAPGRTVDLACNEYPGTTFPRGDQFLRGFSDEPSPTWTYAGDGWTLEKRLHLLDDQNTVILSYRLLESKTPFEFTARPLYALRPQRDLMYQWNGRLSAEKRTRQDYRIPATHRTPELFFTSDGAFDPKACWYYNTIYRGTPDAAANDAPGLEDLWSPGQLSWTLAPGASAHFACSTDPLSLPSALAALRAPAEKIVTAQVSDLVRAAVPVARPAADAPRRVTQP